LKPPFAFSSSLQQHLHHHQDFWHDLHADPFSSPVLLSLRKDSQEDLIEGVHPGGAQSCTGNLLVRGFKPLYLLRIKPFEDPIPGEQDWNQVSNGEKPDWRLLLSASSCNKYERMIQQIKIFTFPQNVAITVC